MGNDKPQKSERSEPVNIPAKFYPQATLALEIAELRREIEKLSTAIEKLAERIKP